MQVSLDATGQALITTQLIAPNADASCPGTLQLKLFTPLGFQIPNNIVHCGHIGMTVTAKVTHLASGNSCSGTLTVEDFLPPTVVCSDKFIFCNQDASPGAIGFPTMTDNCTAPNNLTFNYIDNETSLGCGVFQNGQPVLKRIDRTWFVTDERGNTTECLQKIWLKHITLADVKFPPSRDGFAAPALNCGEDPNDFAVSGQPTVEGIPIENSPDCEIGVVYSDQIINICPPAGYSVLRTWTAVDFCNGQISSKLQIIKIEDKTPPSIAPVDDITVGTDGFLCTGTVDLPHAETSDDCSAVTVTPIWLYGSGFGPFAGVPEGTYVVTYKATDACGNSSTTTMRVTVADASPPSAICTALLQASLSAGGVGYVNAGTVDGGSFDNCGPVTLAISRDDSAFVQTLQVTCDDIGDPLPVTLRVTDAVGLENFCEAAVSIRDFLKPNLTCPADVTLTCLQDFNDLQLTGLASASDNCALQSLDFTDIVNIQPCNVGFVTRQWKATDAEGNTKICAQQIAVQAISNVTVSFPANVTVSVCADPSAMLPPATGEPVTNGKYCSPLSVTYSDQIFTSALPPACYRIFRSWQVTDFCIYDPNNDSIGVWKHTQIIDIVDDTPPTLTLPADITLNADFPDCTAQVTLDDATATDCGDQISISNNGIFAAASGANASGTYPLGVHQIVFTATDNCGNIAQQTLRITVQDLLPPKALCKNGVVELDSTGAATLDATLLDNGSSDHCTPSANLSFTVTPESFSCQNIGFQTVTLTVTDVAGNAATCSATVNVTDPANACLPPSPVTFNIEGSIRTEKGLPVAEIPLTLLGDGFLANAECEADGHYIFEDVPGNNYFTLKPVSNAKWLNGLSTFDLVLISKHILGLDTLDSPYKLIAADANRSGTITTFDIVQFRRVILGISDTVPGNTSWRFVDADFSFPDPANPFATLFPEQKIFNTLSFNQVGQDFIGVKIGDLNNTTDATDPRTPHDTLIIYAPLKKLVPEEMVVLPFYLKNWRQLEGFQFELQLDEKKAALQKVEFAKPEIFSAANLVSKPDGKVAVSWNNSEMEEALTHDSLLFTLFLKVREQAVSDEIILVNPERIKPEAYRGGDDLPAGIALEFAAEPAASVDGLSVLPVRPNPFVDEAVLPFVLADAVELTLTLSDVSGWLVYERKKTFSAGRNEWHIERQDLPGAGVYYYRLALPNGLSRGGLVILTGL
ncbi:MAG: hypothetical protein OHK0019_05140 [Saprospiraceae bacterium]